MFCPTCMFIFSQHTEYVHGTTSLHGTHHDSFSSLCSAVDSCRICRLVWLVIADGFDGEVWSHEGTRTLYTVVAVAEGVSIEDAIASRRNMELRIDIEGVLSDQETKTSYTNHVNFGLLPYEPAEHYVGVELDDPRTLDRTVMGDDLVCQRDSLDPEADRTREDFQVDPRSRSGAWGSGDLSGDGNIDETRENMERCSLQDRIIDEDVLPQLTRSRLLKWYHDCRNHHPDCKALHSPGHPPTRLLDIGTTLEDPVRIVTLATREPQTSNVEYATLSHCWGSSQPLRLLTSNIEQFQQAICREAIPRIFSQAIEVCWYLGIRYLWIDSLCILQDSAEDWSRESQRMGTTYSGALINIGATGSPGCNGELLGSTHHAPSVDLVAWEREGRAPVQYVVVENDSEWNSTLKRQPLLRRAWVMQERLLATRMVHFTTPQVIWECRTTTATETYPIRVPGVLRSFHDARNNFWREFTDDSGAWATLVADYSECDLTFGRDKLVALSGLVSTLQAMGLDRGRYCAGLWEADFPHNLFWVRAAIDPTNARTARPAAYRAPSWSWASLDYPVWMSWLQASSENVLVSECEVREERISEPAASLLCDSPLPLHLSGPISTAVVQTRSPEDHTYGRIVERRHGISYRIACIDNTIPFSDDPANDVVFDDLKEGYPQRRIWCAPIQIGNEWRLHIDNEKLVFGLLLENVSDNVFRRIGMFSIGNPADRQALESLKVQKYVIC